MDTEAFTYHCVYRYRSHYPVFSLSCQKRARYARVSGSAVVTFVNIIVNDSYLLTLRFTLHQKQMPGCRVRYALCAYMLYIIIFNQMLPFYTNNSLLGCRFMQNYKHFRINSEKWRSCPLLDLIQVCNFPPFREGF